jgi:hypothetical protein
LCIDYGLARLKGAGLIFLLAKAAKGGPWIDPWQGHRDAYEKKAAVMYRPHAPPWGKSACSRQNYNGFPLNVNKVFPEPTPLPACF